MYLALMQPLWSAICKMIVDLERATVVAGLFLACVAYMIVPGLAAESPKQPRRIVNKFGMEFVEVPPGRFIMGSVRGGPTEKPHKVEITKPFFMGVMELTGWELDQIHNAEGKTQPDAPRTPRWDTDRAIDIVSWHKANELAEQLSALDSDYDYRLPTEAEWEYACRGATDITEPAADDSPVSQPYHVEYGPIEPVKREPPNAFGLYDMLRNAGEYCSDWYAADYYERSPVKDPTGPAEGRSKVARGVRSEGHDRSYSCWKRYITAPEGDSNILLGVRFVLVEKNQGNAPEETARPQEP
jgi:formylglycine-generating enzyme required for sulfatase activity